MTGEKPGTAGSPERFEYQRSQPSVEDAYFLGWLERLGAVPLGDPRLLLPTRQVTQADFDSGRVQRVVDTLLEAIHRISALPKTQPVGLSANQLVMGRDENHQALDIFIALVDPHNATTLGATFQAYMNFRVVAVTAATGVLNKHGCFSTGYFSPVVETPASYHFRAQLSDRTRVAGQARSHAGAALWHEAWHNLGKLMCDHPNVSAINQVPRARIDESRSVSAADAVRLWHPKIPLELWRDVRDGRRSPFDDPALDLAQQEAAQGLIQLP